MVAEWSLVATQDVGDSIHMMDWDTLFAPFELLATLDEGGTNAEASDFGMEGVPVWRPVFRLAELVCGCRRVSG
jgi:hypothetical protein